MSIVLAIEPDRAQAGLLREVLHGTPGVQLVIVSTKDEAIEAIERDVPDLVLVNALLSPREEDELVSHLRTIENASHLQLLTIPRLGRPEAAPQAGRKSSIFGFGKKKAQAAVPERCDPAAFAEQVTSYLARAREVRTRPRPRVVPLPRPAPPPAVIEDAAPLYEPPAPTPAYESATPLYEPPAPAYEPSVPTYEPPPVVADAWPDERVAPVAPQAEPAPPALIDLSDPQWLADEQPAGDIDSVIERLGFTVPLEEPRWHDASARTHGERPREDQTATGAPPSLTGDDVSLIELGSDVSLIELGSIADSPPLDVMLVDMASPAAPFADPVRTLDASFASDAPAPADDGLEIDLTPILDIAQVRAEAEATLAAELQRVQTEAARQREQELAEWQAEAEALREATVGRARAEAEAKAREALASELERSRAEAEQLRHEELARLQAEAGERLEEVTRQARQVAEAEAARAFSEELARVRAEAENAATRALESEVSRVRSEADTRLQAELERVRKEAEEARRTQQTAAQADAERIREAAAREAREVAEAAAARALEAEIQRVRSEAEAMRAAAEARLAEQSKSQADASEALAEAARLRETAAREAREIAEAAAAQKLEAELARVRAEADARLARQKDEQVKAEKLREAAAREARLVAEAAASRALEREIEKVRAEADARLASELAQLRADAERRRALELEEMRRRVDEVREAAAEQARAAAADAVATEVARVTAARAASAPRTIAVARPPSGVKAAPSEPALEASPAPGAPQSTPASGSYYDLWRSEGSPALSSEILAPVRSLPSAFRRKPWMLPAAASVLLVASGSISVDTSEWRATAKSALAAALPASRPAPDPAAADAAAGAPSTGNLLVETTPKGARVKVDGVERGHTPLTVTNLAPGRHKLVLESNDGVVIQRDVTIRVGERAVASELMVSGWLTVFSRVPLEVHVDGRRVGASGDQISLSPGRHKVTFVNRQWNVRETRTIEVQAGSIASHTVKLPSGTLHVDAPAGADVWVDDERVGQAPLRGASVAIGTHNVVVRHPSFGERRETIEVRLGAPVTVRLDASGTPQTGGSFNGLKVLSESKANPGVRKPLRPQR